MGRTRLKGERLANLSAVAEDPATAWTSITVSDWYGGKERTVEVASATAVWYSTVLSPVPLRWVLIRDPKEEFETQASLCTDLNTDPERIIGWFVRRWQMEATFQEVRQRLGFETQRHWSEQAVFRTAPALLGLFSVVSANCAYHDFVEVRALSACVVICGPCNSASSACISIEPGAYYCSTTLGEKGGGACTAW
jgi:hypothetical protein